MRILFWISVLALLLFTCKKPEGEDTPKNHFALDTLLLNKYFHQGSYWVYENSNNIQDSVWVVIHSYGTCEFDQGYAIVTDQFYNMRLYSSAQNKAFNHFFVRGRIYLKTSSCGKTNPCSENIALCDPENIRIIFNLNDSLDAGYEMKETIPVLSVADTTFYNITRVSLQARLNYPYQFDYPTDYFWSDTFGIVQQIIYKTPKNDTMRLRRWNLIP